MVARFIACNSIESPYYKNGSFVSIHLVFFEKGFCFIECVHVICTMQQLSCRLASIKIG